MSPTDRAMVAQQVSVVFHVAATVRFDEKMKLAVPINVRSPRDIIELCKEMCYLKASERYRWADNAHTIFYVPIR